MGWPSGVVGEAEREGDGLTTFDRGGQTLTLVLLF